MTFPHLVIPFLLPIHILWTIDSFPVTILPVQDRNRRLTVKKNDELLLTADGLDSNQAGVCRHEGMVVFVPGLLPGETARVKIIKTEKRFAIGRMESPSESPAPFRRIPDCPAFPRCGGCSCRHMTYEATLEAKRLQVQNCFHQIAGLDLSVPVPSGMEDPTAYRNKTSLPVGGTADQPLIGFFASRSHAIIPVDRCPNAMPPAEEIIQAFLRWIRKKHIPPYQESGHCGILRHLVIRTNLRGESMVTVVGNAPSLPCAEDLVQALIPLKVVSLFFNSNREKSNVILSDSFHHIYGRNTLPVTLCGLRFELSPASFFQVNPIQTEKLYASVRSMANLKPDDTVCDVYCGVGTITLMLALHCRKVLGIEVVPPAVENAKRNAAFNGIQNADFLCGDAEKILPRLVSDGMKPDVIVVDPPRKGLAQAVIQAITQAAPDRLVYVSCNPATLARDVQLFYESGYSVNQVQPVDMFAWTSGVETVCLLSKRTAV